MSPEGKRKFSAFELHHISDGDSFPESDDPKGSETYVGVSERC